MTVKHDSGKVQIGLVPPVFVTSVAKILTWAITEKENPYKKNSWQRVPKAKDRYYDALQRHILAWKDGEDYDDESRYHHLAHAATNALILLWYELKTKVLRKEVE